MSEKGSRRTLALFDGFWWKKYIVWQSVEFDWTEKPYKRNCLRSEAFQVFIVSRLSSIAIDFHFCQSIWEDVFFVFLAGFSQLLSLLFQHSPKAIDAYNPHQQHLVMWWHSLMDLNLCVPWKSISSSWFRNASKTPRLHLAKTFNWLHSFAQKMENNDIEDCYKVGLEKSVSERSPTCRRCLFQWMFVHHSSS